jgi:hypothetical protein
MRYNALMVRELAATVVLSLTSCQAPGGGATSGAATTPGVTTASGSSGGETSSTGGDTSTSESSGAASGGTSSGEPPLDLGVTPDFGDGPPAGCKGKIDILFVMSRHPSSRFVQEQLIAAFPQFIAAIESKFSDFDYHIMVIDGDGPVREWGDAYCNHVCPDLSCKIEDPCCPDHNSPGDLCCTVPDYPCDYVDDATPCDSTWGAGTVFPAGDDASNKMCAIDGGRRYLIKGQTDLAETFVCLAQVGTSGDHRLGQALTAAMQKSINDPGGCNGGFLRKDALLLVALFSNTADEGGRGYSEGTPYDWAQAVLAAKGGDPEAVVMLSVLRKDCPGYDGICRMAKMFPYWVTEDSDAPDYGPAFDAATDLVETACAGFVPPG